ncbi:histidine kinase [Leptobacterium flavescens]|uniref:Histidine kinase n=1 Tax=Leptobacterium flavescens TaxID=472055 RepID=A0A6P0UUQ1_9FLAO|nr:2TM domain-containing protein [Leptobacterium flavescens]NER14136.1 histidine kinase [Leptobacterium flavescens]
MENLTKIKEDRYKRAKERVEEIKGFYWNLGAFIVVIPLMATFNYWQNGWDNPWILWVVMGWGLGLIFHAMETFEWNLFLGKDWEQRKIKEFMDEDYRR